MKNNKIKNFVIRHPYWSTLFFPFFVPIIIFILLSFIGDFVYTAFDENIGEDILDYLFFLLPYIFLIGIPSWIIYCIVVADKKKRVKLIVLCFSIWILAFILLFLYDAVLHSIHHSTPVKPNATKSIHSQTVKHIAAETMKCQLGETTIMDGNLTCSELNAVNVVAAAVKTLTDKNPYSIKNNAVRISTSNTKDEDVGYVNLSASGSDVVVKSCHKKPCSENYNRLKYTIEIK